MTRRGCAACPPTGQICTDSSKIGKITVEHLAALQRDRVLVADGRAEEVGDVKQLDDVAGGLPSNRMRQQHDAGLVSDQHHVLAFPKRCTASTVSYSIRSRQIYCFEASAAAQLRLCS